MFRVYDTKEKEWVKQNVYIAQNEDMFIAKKSFFKHNKLHIMSEKRYVLQNCIGLKDRENNFIFEGDICEFLGSSKGIVLYVEERASYFLFDFYDKKYYNLSESFCGETLQIIGNQFDNPDMISEV